MDSEYQEEEDCLVVNVAITQYSIVREVACKLHWRLCPKKVTTAGTCAGLTPERLLRMKPRMYTRAQEHSGHCPLRGEESLALQLLSLSWVLVADAASLDQRTTCKDIHRKPEQAARMHR